MPLCCVNTVGRKSSSLWSSDSVQRIPKWNFWKFLVNSEGQVVRFWRPEEPMEEIRREATGLVREIILKKRHELWGPWVQRKCSWKNFTMVPSQNLSEHHVTQKCVMFRWAQILLISFFSSSESCIMYMYMYDWYFMDTFLMLKSQKSGIFVVLVFQWRWLFTHTFKVFQCLQ